MENKIRLYGSNEPEYISLVKAAKTIEQKTGVKIAVQPCYFDIDQDWQYSALIADPDSRWGGWQCATPAQYERIVSGDPLEYEKGLSAVVDSITRLKRR